MQSFSAARAGLRSAPRVLRIAGQRQTRSVANLASFKTPKVSNEPNVRTWHSHNANESIHDPWLPSERSEDKLPAGAAGGTNTHWTMWIKVLT